MDFQEFTYTDGYGGAGCKVICGVPAALRPVLIPPSSSRVDCSFMTVKFMQL